MKAPIRLPLLGTALLVPIALLALHAHHNSSAWEKYNLLGKQSFEIGNYVEAEGHWLDAVRVAEHFSDKDPRLTSTLVNLAELYRMEQRDDEAFDMSKRALAPWGNMALSGNAELSGSLSKARDILTGYTARNSVQ
jgi:tetratricopeptide (TPR) repeat protein